MITALWNPQTNRKQPANPNSGLPNTTNEGICLFLYASAIFVPITLTAIDLALKHVMRKLPHRQETLKLMLMYHRRQQPMTGWDQGVLVGPWFSRLACIKLPRYWLLFC
jgi:hypothetical protein